MKTIRKIKESKEEDEKKKQEERLESLKTVSKPELKKLALQILKEELLVDEDNLKQIATKKLHEEET
jgi:hypothetical protein